MAMKNGAMYFDRRFLFVWAGWQEYLYMQNHEDITREIIYTWNVDGNMDSLLVWYHICKNMQGWITHVEDLRDGLWIVGVYQGFWIKYHFCFQKRYRGTWIYKTRKDLTCWCGNKIGGGGFQKLMCIWDESHRSRQGQTNPQNTAILTTLAETNIAPENRKSQMEIHLPTIDFQSFCC